MENMRAPFLRALENQEDVPHEATAAGEKAVEDSVKEAEKGVPSGMDEDITALAGSGKAGNHSEPELVGGVSNGGPLNKKPPHSSPKECDYSAHSVKAFNSCQDNVTHQGVKVPTKPQEHWFPRKISSRFKVHTLSSSDNRHVSRNKAAPENVRSIKDDCYSYVGLDLCRIYVINQCGTQKPKINSSC